MERITLHSCPELIEYINKTGFLPLLNIGIEGWSANDLLDEEYQYCKLPDGGWEWPLWKWKSSILQESGCAYGKFFNKKVAFISREWWPEFYNYRRSIYPKPEEGSIEDCILMTLKENGSLITRDLRKACGFTGNKMRSKFDAYISNLEMGCYIVTKNFIYPRDKHGKEYGWGWAELTTPELLFGKNECRSENTPEESLKIIKSHFMKIIPDYKEKIYRLLK